MNREENINCVLTAFACSGVITTEKQILDRPSTRADEDFPIWGPGLGCTGDPGLGCTGVPDSVAEGSLIRLHKGPGLG